MTADHHRRRAAYLRRAAQHNRDLAAEGCPRAANRVTYAEQLDIEAADHESIADQLAPVNLPDGYVAVLADDLAAILGCAQRQATGPYYRAPYERLCAVIGREP